MSYFYELADGTTTWYQDEFLWFCKGGFNVSLKMTTEELRVLIKFVKESV